MDEIDVNELMKIDDYFYLRHSMELIKSQGDLPSKLIAKNHPKSK